MTMTWLTAAFGGVLIGLSATLLLWLNGRIAGVSGLLNQRRWWTVTRARLCAQHIIREHLGAFGLPERA